MTRLRTVRTVLTLLLAATSTAAFAARSNKSASPLPKNPAALLALAARHNGLTGPHLKPWYIKATYQLYNTKGKPTQKGTFEEWWDAPNKYKITFNRTNYHMQLVVNAKGTFISGNGATPYPEYLVRRIFVHPVSAKPPANVMKLHLNMEKFGKVHLDCIEEIPKGLRPTGFHTLTLAFPTYCVEPSIPMLRIYGSYGQSLTQFTGIGSLEGRYVPIRAVVFDSGRKYLTVHLLKGEIAAKWPPSVFTAPPGAVSLPSAPSHLLHLTAKEIASSRISGKNPIYPESAKENHQQGTVLLSVLIGEDGRIRSLIVTSAPAMSLADSALAAVKTWRYKPHLLNGHAVNVETSIHVVYALGS